MVADFVSAMLLERGPWQWNKIRIWIHSISRTSIRETNAAPENVHGCPGIPQGDQDYASKTCQLPARTDCGIDCLKVANSTRRCKSYCLTLLLSWLVDRIPADSTLLPFVESIYPRHVLVIERKVENVSVRVYPGRRSRFRKRDESAKIFSTT